MSFCTLPVVKWGLTPPRGDVGWVNVRFLALLASPFPFIPAQPPAPRRTISHWWRYASNLHAFIEFKGVLFSFFFLSHCDLHILLISIVRGRTGDRYYEWMNRGTLTAPLPAYEECCQWGVNDVTHQAMVIIIIMISFFYFFLLYISVFWLERTSPCRLATPWFLFM